MQRFYVDLNGIDDKTLEFFGYFVVLANDEFKLYQDHAGDEYLVLQSNPHLYVDDPNDAAYLNAQRVVVISVKDD